MHTKQKIHECTYICNNYTHYNNYSLRKILEEAKDRDGQNWSVDDFSGNCLVVTQRFRTICTVYFAGNNNFQFVAREH